MSIFVDSDRLTMIPLDNKILILDGAMGTMIQRHGLTEEDYHSGPFAGCA